MNTGVPPVAPAGTLSTAFASAGRAQEEEIARAARSLESDVLLSTLLDAMPDLVMVLNEHRQIIYANQALVRFAHSRSCDAFLGLRPGELLACDVVGQSPNGCGTGEACRNCGAVLTILQSLDGQKNSHECRILSTFGGNVSAFDLQVWGTPFTWQGQRCVLLVAGDIGPQKRRQVLERIFFHDIMNTAGGIQGIANLLDSGDVPVADVLKDLRFASESLVGQIESQRMLVAAEANELVVTPHPIEALALLETVARSFRNHAVAEGREVGLAEDLGDFTFESDPALLGRVLGNLLKNALEASDPGQRVTLGYRRNGADVSFWCHNPRVMPRDVQLQVFQRSFSTKGSGRGIGTYSIKLLTERYLQGHVSFVSSTTTGTLFTVTLPATFTQEPAAATATPEPAAPAPVT